MSQSSATPMRFTLGKARLHGDLCVPAAARGLVVFVHGSGSAGTAATRAWRAASTKWAWPPAVRPADQARATHRRDHPPTALRHPLLSQRLTGVIDQLSSDAQLRELRIGLFGASTGAAAALTTAASRPADIAAVVSRGGASTRPSRRWHESTPLRCSSSAAAT